MKTFLFLGLSLSVVLGLTQCSALYQTDEELKMDQERQVRLSPWAGSAPYNQGLDQAMADAEKGINQEQKYLKNYQGQDAEAYKAGYQQGLSSAAAVYRLHQRVAQSR